MTKTPNTTPQPNYPDQITGDKPQPGAEYAVINAADLRGMDGLSEQDAGLLEQAASMLEGLHNDERNRGNCSAAEGAACSAEAVRRLAVQLLRAAQPARECLQQSAEPEGLAEVSKEQYARMFGAACEALGEISDHLGIDSDINPGAEPIIEAIDELRAAALQAAPPAPPAVPVLYVSPEQLAKHSDPEGAESAEAGRYLPTRKTPAGKFTQPLYARPPAPAGVAVPDAWALIEELVKTESHKTRLHQQYMGKAMPDAEYERFQRMRDERIPELRAQLRAALAAAPAQAVAWMTPEGDRVVTEATMASARKDGGAMLSSLRPFTVALGPIAAPAQSVAVPQGAHVPFPVSMLPQFKQLADDAMAMAEKLQAEVLARATAPAQEHATQLATLHATQLAGQGQEPARVVESVKFTDQSAADPVDKARRYLKHVADCKPNNPYFFDDGYPRREIAADASAALAVLEQLAAAPIQAHEDARAQHDRDSAELRRLCEDRDKARRERDLCKAEIAGLESSCGHLGRLVDELRAKAERYDYLRDRDLGAIQAGGVFAGKTPDNVVLNGGDLDAAIDAARAAQGGAA